MQTTLSVTEILPDYETFIISFLGNLCFVTMRTVVTDFKMENHII